MLALNPTLLYVCGLGEGTADGDGTIEGEGPIEGDGTDDGDGIIN